MDSGAARAINHSPALPHPSIFNMPWPSPGRDQDDIDADVVSRPGETGGKDLRCCCHARKPAMIDGICQIALTPPYLYFDKDQDARPAGDNIDLAARGPDPSCKNAKALEPQIP